VTGGGKTHIISDVTSRFLYHVLNNDLSLSMTIKLLTAAESDSLILLDLWERTYREAYKDVHRSEDIDAYVVVNFTAENAKALLQDKEVACRLAIHNEKYVGFYILKPGIDVITDTSGVELKQIYILSEAYGMGLGRQLFDDAVQVAKAAGHEYMWLSVSNRNHRAKRFYEKLNFQIVGTGPIFEVGTDRLSSTIMSLALTP